MATSLAPDTRVEFQDAPGELLYKYNLDLPALDPAQSATVPHTYLDSMHVREQVFVYGLMAVPLKHHMDRDDARSCHWVLYRSDNLTEKTPVGTIRLVPYPNHAHPPPGARFTAPDDDVPGMRPETLFSAPLPKYAIDKATTLHDGIEPFVKLGRLCVLEEYRGRRYADQLIQSALEWARQHPEFSAPDENLNDGQNIPKWKGLVCIHAHIKAVGAWKRNGFVVDEGMASWFEGGMEHVGMFCRLKLA